jgi:hypothetical protein
MFVSGLVRAEEADPSYYARISRRVPGSRTARRALNVDNGRLTKQNFLKGQAINGPSGVMARLARDLDMIDEDGQVAGGGHDLRSAWARKAVSDNDAEGETGSDLTRKAMTAVAKDIEDGSWPKPSAAIWGMLTDSLRPDRIPAAECKIISKHLHQEQRHGLRPRVLDLLRDKHCLTVYRKCSDELRGKIERSVLLDGVRPLLGSDPVDEQIALAIRTIDAYEEFSVAFTAAFDVMLWALRKTGGAASPQRLLEIGPLGKTLESSGNRLANLLPTLRDILPLVSRSGPFEEQQVPALMTIAFKDTEGSIGPAENLLNALLTRHERVQREKRKPTWVDRSVTWTLMPGTPVIDEPRASPFDGFMHPYRIINAYSLMRDLRLVKGVKANGEDPED